MKIFNLKIYGAYPLPNMAKQQKIIGFAVINKEKSPEE